MKFYLPLTAAIYLIATNSFGIEARSVVVPTSVTSKSSDSLKLKNAFVIPQKKYGTNTDEISLSVPRGGDASDGLGQRLKIGFFFGLWYFLNVCYNIVNKKVLNVLPAPMTVGSMQFGVGMIYVVSLWLLKLRSVPKLTKHGRDAIRNSALCHSSGQLLTMISLGAGPVSFTHIVKALEPFFSAIVSALIFGKWMKPQVYATLLPVVGGVGYACMKERSFSMVSFVAAMASNLAFALRAVLSKIAMTPSSDGKTVGENMTSTNVFGLVTMVAFFLSIPLAIVTEGSKFGSLWSKALSVASSTSEGSGINDTVAQAAASSVAAVSRGKLIQSIIISGLFHYLNNEVMYLTLGSVHPVTLAVGNTMKRVFIIVASVVVFNNPISIQAGIGSAIGISGVLLYSLVKQHYENLEKKET